MNHHSNPIVHIDAVDSIVNIECRLNLLERIVERMNQAHPSVQLTAPQIETMRNEVVDSMKIRYPQLDINRWTFE